jgi:hypothetical protein
MKALWPSLLLAFAASIGAQPQRPPEFARAAELALEGKGAIYALELPLGIYRGLERRDLGDLRVHNGAGEVVPHALLRPASSERKPVAPVALPFFPLLGPAGRAIEDLQVRVERRPDGAVKAFIGSAGRGAPARSTVAYILDAGEPDRPIRELRFDWQAGAEGTSIDARIEASEDLKSWRTIGSGALIVLRHGEALLERRAIEVRPTKAKYLRVSWRPSQEAWKLAGVSAVPIDTVAETPRAWLQVPGSAGTKSGEYVFELPLALPVDRLRFELPQENTVASTTVLVQPRPGAPERAIASPVLYRMEHKGQKLVSPDLEIPATMEPRWVLRVDPRGGGLGNGMPALHAGYVPHRLVFVARGEPPFRVLFGDKEARPAALAVHTIVPGYAAEKPLPALAAKAGEVRAREIVKREGLEAVREYAARLDEKKLWLWGSLLLAVIVIVGMAIRLSRQMPAPGERPRPRAPGETR